MTATATAKERPILFSLPMVQAILEGRKTQTRRAIKPQPHAFESGNPIIYDRPLSTKIISCPYGIPGDRLWVREAFYCDDYRYPDAPPSELLELMEYRASHDCTNWEVGCPCTKGGWRPSIHMPRWASRITLEITEVRVERLQAINGSDALAEGAGDGTDDREVALNDFVALWDAINGKDAWDANPWVWAVSFRRISQEQHP